MYVYQRLPAGGYTALPVQSEKERSAKVKEGWLTEPPVDTPVLLADAPDVTEPTPKKRWRPRAETVN